MPIRSHTAVPMLYKEMVLPQSSTAPVSCFTIFQSTNCSISLRTIMPDSEWEIKLLSHAITFIQLTTGRTDLLLGKNILMTSDNCKALYPGLNITITTLEDETVALVDIDNKTTLKSFDGKGKYGGYHGAAKTMWNWSKQELNRRLKSKQQDDNQTLVEKAEG